MSFRLNDTRCGHSGRAVLLLCGFWSAWAQAGTISVNPVRATLSAGEQVGALTVRNDGAGTTVVQLEVLSWSQQDGKDVYTPTREILANPPIFTIPAGGEQIIRVGLRRAPDPKRELSYRLYLHEVPSPPKPGFQGLQVALRIGVPVFVIPTDVAATPALRWQAIRTPEGQLKLGLSNSGNAHVQVANFKLAQTGKAAARTQDVAAYLLPGQSREWLVTAAVPPGERLHLFAQTDAGDVHAELVVEKP